MDTKHIKITDYNYPLPDERIAKFPLAQRDHSKLLLYRHGEVGEDVFYRLPEYLPKGGLMVYNNTKVIQARLQGDGCPDRGLPHGACRSYRL
jgi:S-adenosylmethionine:tRNA ribosyltransferase-isomerase